MIINDGDRIVFSGDSVTDAGRVYPIGQGFCDGVGKGYVRVVQDLIAVWYPEMNVRITNVGVGGENSRDMLKRFNDDVVALNPDWVSICIGINDVWRQFDSPAILNSHVLPDEYERNVEEMILKVKGKVKGIFILSPYIMEANKEDFMRKRMDEYVAISKKLAEKHGCVFVDFQKVYEDYCKIRHSSYISWDRIHPNQVGATLMAREFLKYCNFDFNHGK